MTILFLACHSAKGQKESPIQIVKPVESMDVLINPGIGFISNQRFDGDSLTGGRGFYPRTSVAFYCFFWQQIEPIQGHYDWSAIDDVLKKAAQLGQTVIIRIPPYKTARVDVPQWYREMVGKEVRLRLSKWRVDPADPRYAKYYGDMIRAFGKRYDGHPNLESVDISLVGSHGEGAGTHLMPDQARLDLINAYLDSFKKTFLNLQVLSGDAPDPGLMIKNTRISASWPDGTNNGSGPQMMHVGWRVDCLGDMGFWPHLGQNHMTDFYPRGIIRCGMSEAWEKAPVTMEICGIFSEWLEKQKYNKDTVDYIFEQAIKWHISSFNAKSTAIPESLIPQVNEWIKKMGYRFVLRRFTYPMTVNIQGQLPVTTWWENKGDAPVYKDFKFAIRLRNKAKSEVFITRAYLPHWLPGDIVYDEILYLPHDIPAGVYTIEVAIVSPVTFEPKVKLAITGGGIDGWYPMGEISLEDNSNAHPEGN